MNINLLNRLKRISSDFFINIVASFLLTGILQLVVYPCLAASINSVDYGEILTIMGIINTIIVTLGNTLNNVRLITNTKYVEEKLEGDFNLLLIYGIVVSGFFCFFIMNVFFEKSFVDIIWLSILLTLGISKSYLSVEYRLILNFRKVLFNNFFGAIGCIVGILLFKFSGFWLLPFLVSEVFQLSYCLSSSHIIKENLTKTTMFRSTYLKYITLIIAGMFSNLLMYMDRMVIFPVLGGSYVSYYNTASFFGKSLGLLMIPIGSVLLGYYAQKDFSMSKKKFWIINLIAVLVGLLFIVVAYFVSPLVTAFIYPSLYSEAEEYIFIANLVATLSIVASLTQIAILRFAPTWLQIVKELIYGIIYIMGGYFLLTNYGLYGFCIAALVANIVKIITLYIVGAIYICD